MLSLFSSLVLTLLLTMIYSYLLVYIFFHKRVLMNYWWAQAYVRGRGCRFGSVLKQVFRLTSYMHNTRAAGLYGTPTLHSPPPPPPR